jgi:hypothetical protein
VCGEAVERAPTSPSSSPAREMHRRGSWRPPEAIAARPWGGGRGRTSLAARRAVLPARYLTFASRWTASPMPFLRISKGDIIP